MAPPSKIQFGYHRHPDQDRSEGDAARHPVVIVGAGPVGLSLAIDLAQRGQDVVLLDDADRIGEGSRAICFSKRSLEYWDRLGIGQRMVDKGVVWSVGRIFHGASQLYQFNLLPEAGPQAARLHQPAAIPCRSLSGRPRPGASRGRPALAQQGDGARAAQRSCGADGRDAGRSLPDTRRLCRRLRRRPFLAAAAGGGGIRRKGLRGSVSDRRRQDDGGISDRALVLVRSAVSCRPLGAAAPAAGRHLADRSATQSRRGSRGREAAGKRPAADRAHARPRQVRVRVDLALQVPVPPDGQVHPWPGDLCRRCRASGVAVRGKGRQFRAGRRRESRLETGSGAAQDFAGSAARELSHRAQRRGRREHPGIDPLDRFHGAGLEPGSAPAQGGAVARQGNRIRQAHDQWRTALDALDLRLAALDRRYRDVARRPAARRFHA